MPPDAPDPSDAAPARRRDKPFRPRCLALDLEAGAKDQKIHAVGAIRPDIRRRLRHEGRSGLEGALRQLDQLAEGAEFLLGHNLIKHDLPYLKAENPDLRLLRLPVVDTLRLSPLAFPRNPYHRLVKHYKDADFRSTSLNDPKQDARLAVDLFREEREALAAGASGLLAAWHWLSTTKPGPSARGMDRLFRDLRQQPRPSRARAQEAIRARLDGAGCAAASVEVIERVDDHGWPLAYALAWLSVAGGNSVMPPWVRHQFPAAPRLVRRLRDTSCAARSCDWCRERHDARRELTRWFGFPDFRATPRTAGGLPMQRAIVEAAMAGEHVLGILPTGAGKSVCYQLPALSRYDRIGALTVVISPLVALMADQVAGLEKRGITGCLTVNSLLSLPERKEALDRIRLGGAGIALIAPEQLRSPTVRKALDQREIGGWVLDEAHCLSRWGHDFRPDYLYVGRFIREQAARSGSAIPPVMCLTATAKPDVRDDIARHFRAKLKIELLIFDGGAERENLDFEVRQSTQADKDRHILESVEANLAPETRGGAIVYCSTRRRSERVAEFLRDAGVAADHYHAGMKPEARKEVQEQFIRGELRAIAATNAFGMGIDKPDVRLVLHADVPGSLENYVQEAGRAGRDGAPAKCVLLYSPDDVERQFGLSARSRLAHHEIVAILKALRRLDGWNRRHRSTREVVVTSGEILREETEDAFERDKATDDTRTRIAVAWLEEAHFLERNENQTRVFPSSLRFPSIEKAEQRLMGEKGLSAPERGRLLGVVRIILEADADDGISTDELMAECDLSSAQVASVLTRLHRFGITTGKTALTAFVHRAVPDASARRLEEARNVESALIAQLRDEAPDLTVGESSRLNLRIAAQCLQDDDVMGARPERLMRIVRSIRYDGHGDGPDAGGSWTVRKKGRWAAEITLRRDWEELEALASNRRNVAGRLLTHFLERLPKGARGKDLLAETTLEELGGVVRSELFTSSAADTEELAHRAILWLHEQEVIRVHKGLWVFRPAMRIRMQRQRRGYTKRDFEPLRLHYTGQILQIHVMKEFAERGVKAIGEARRLAKDYFTMEERKFLDRWLPGREEELRMQTTPESRRRIVDDLRNPEQETIVADDREDTNVLVLAGPGSGKTRVLVHRIAYLVRVRREAPHGVVALTYNRHAAVQIRRRLRALIGDDARRVTVLTCHALAMRLLGRTFADRKERLDKKEVFRNLLREATDLLEGKDLPSDDTGEAEVRRERLLAGFRWIFVDEYQDIGDEEYRLISALAGRTKSADGEKLTLFAVGDDDQNIYSFKGASVRFIRSFQEDYGPHVAHLTQNYRSSRRIIEVSNAVIAGARERMKGSRHEIRIHAARRHAPPGGRWEELDPEGCGRVQILPVGHDFARQAVAVVGELRRCAALDPDWEWSRCAVVAREWRFLDPVRAVCELAKIPVQVGNQEMPPFWKLRETREFVGWLRARESRLIEPERLSAWLREKPTEPWWDLLRQAMEEHKEETGRGRTPVAHLIEWLAEWGHEVRRRQRGLLLTTAHSAKGLEFDHVAVLDGGWDRISDNEDPDAPRRLYYVAMTRARETLLLARMESSAAPHEKLLHLPTVLQRQPGRRKPIPPEARCRTIRLRMSDVDLGFAGSHPAGDPIHRRIANLSPGDALTTRVNGPGWDLIDTSGQLVGRLARKFDPPDGMRCRSANVAAIVAWSREASDPKYLPRYRCDEWEVILPELVFEPDPNPSDPDRALSPSEEENATLH